MSDLAPIPPSLVSDVDMFVDKAHSDAAKYHNVTLLDGSQTYSLLRLIGRAYASGWNDGHRVGMEEARVMSRADENRADDQQHDRAHAQEEER